MPKPRKRKSARSPAKKPGAAELRRQLTVGQLVNLGLHQLGETGLNFVVILQGSEYLLSNAPNRLAVAILEDAAEFTYKLREKGIEVRVEQMVERGQWGGED